MAGWTLPERTFARTVLLRGLAFWPGVRLLLAAPAMLAAVLAGRPPTAMLAPEPAPLVVVVAAALTFWETRRRGEHLLLANLGTGPAGVALLSLAPPLLAEVVLRLLVRP